MYNFALSKDSNYPLGKINPLDLCIDSLFYEEKNSTKFSPGIKGSGKKSVNRYFFVFEV